MQKPFTVRREVASGREVRVAGDMEGISPSGEPSICCSYGMLYAAGYADNRWKSEKSPVPFLARDRHGLSEIRFDGSPPKLLYGIEQFLNEYPDRQRLLAAGALPKARLDKVEGLTLMIYRVRWSR